METPFVFGRLAEGSSFTDRLDETRHLITNFKAGSHTILISPRRWGKSSLVKKSAESLLVHEKSIRFCFIDLFSARNEQQFYKLLAKEVLKATSGKWADIMENAKHFLGRLVPQLSFRPDHQGEFDLTLDWKEVARQPDDILDLAEKMAIKKKLKIVVCIDEFQNIKAFENPMAFQKALRSRWQKHQHVTYCLYGSKRNMMMEVFASPSMPFYKFGDLIFLQKIKEEDWLPYLIRRFSQTGKKLSRELAIQIAQLTECHPYYVQQLAQQTWLRTSTTCSAKIIAEAADSLLQQLSLLFQNMTDTLTSTQVNFLQALLDGKTQFSSKEVLQDYQLGTSANVLRIKEALVTKEVIDMVGSQIEFLDPMYKRWLKIHYFRSATS